MPHIFMEELNITNKYFINDVIYVYDTYSCFK